MIKVGLTGNIGSGKSTVARIFEILGVSVYFADQSARLMLDNKEVMPQLIETFGKKILTEDLVDRKKLAHIVFNDQQALKELNGIIHPRVRENFKLWMADRKNEPYVIQEAAILFESGFASFFDKVIFVSCPVNIAIQRVIDRDGVTEAEVRLRVQNQWAEEKKTDQSDFIINNDGSQLLIPQVLNIHKELSQGGCR